MPIPIPVYNADGTQNQAGPIVTNLGTYAGPLFFSPHDSLHLSFLLYLFELSHLSTPVSQTHAY